VQLGWWTAFHNANAYIIVDNRSTAEPQEHTKGQTLGDDPEARSKDRGEAGSEGDRHESGGEGDCGKAGHKGGDQHGEGCGEVDDGRQACHEGGGEARNEGRGEAGRQGDCFSRNGDEDGGSGSEGYGEARCEEGRREEVIAPASLLPRTASVRPDLPMPFVVPAT
jgi:hypothetical protein